MAGPTKVVTGEVRLSYVHLFEKYAYDEKQDPKYSVTLLIPKSDTKTIEALRAAEAEATEYGRSNKWGGKVPKDLKPSIIKDGDEDADDYPERRGHWMMTVRSDNKPGVVDANVQPVMDSNEVYSGCYARASLNAFAYKSPVSKGVSFGLNHVQKLRDGEPLGNVTRPEDDFDVVDASGLI